MHKSGFVFCVWSSVDGSHSCWLAELFPMPKGIGVVTALKGHLLPISPKWQHGILMTLMIKEAKFRSVRLNRGEGRE